MGIDRYNSYTESGVEWIGEIPSHWSIKRLKFLTKESLKYGANVPAELIEPDFPRYVRITDVDTNGNLKDETFRSLEPEIAQPYLLQEGDILLARSGATVGKSFIYKDTWGQAAYAGYLIRARINTNKYDPQFLYYTTKSDGYNQWIESITIQATIQNVSAEKYASLYFSIPPTVEEQQSIASFLDKEVSRLDTLIEKKQQFIERLKEKRLAVITNAVTKGIDPSVELKPSGIEWLGDIPKHWEIKRLKFLVELINQKVEHDQDSPLPYIGLENILPWKGELIGTEDNYTPEGISNTYYKDCLLFGKLRPYLAKACLTAKKGLCSSELLVMKPKKEVLPEYLLYCFLSDGFIKDVDSSTYGSKMPRASWDYIGNIRVPIISKEEQAQITEHIHDEIPKIDSLILHAEKAVYKLQEYKTALISAAVTGKIKVTEPS